MDHKTNIILLFTFICALYLLVTSTFRLYKNRYFRSKKFSELNRTTDDITDEYGLVVDLSSQLKRMTYSDFSPSLLDQDKMRNHEEVSLKKMKKMPPRTYLCTKEIMDKFESEPYGLLKEYCGFASSDNILYHIKNINIQVQHLDRAVTEFVEEHAKQLAAVKKSTPLLIRLFSKNQLLLLLGLYVEKDWADKLYPKYVFRDMENRKREICIILNAETMKAIIEDLSNKT